MTNTASYGKAEHEHSEPSRLYRWMVLLFVSMITMGSYFAYDSIGPIAPMLKKALTIGSSEIGAMYSIYSLPNFIMVLIGGIILDKIGTKKGAFIFSFVCMVGAFITAMSSDFGIMLLGRFIFGLGAESLIITQSTIIAKWFKGKELALAFGVNLTVCRIGTFSAFFTLGWVAETFTSWQICLWLAAFICLISVLAAVLYIVMEKNAEKKYKISSQGEQEKFIFSDIWKFKPAFWFISALCVTFYSAIFPFTAFSTDFFYEKHSDIAPMVQQFRENPETKLKHILNNIPTENLKEKERKLISETKDALKDYNTPFFDLKLVKQLSAIASKTIAIEPIVETLDDSHKASSTLDRLRHSLQIIQKNNLQNEEISFVNKAIKHCSPSNYDFTFFQDGDNQDRLLTLSEKYLNIKKIVLDIGSISSMKLNINMLIEKLKTLKTINITNNDRVYINETLSQLENNNYYNVLNEKESEKLTDIGKKYGDLISFLRDEDTNFFTKNFKSFGIMNKEIVRDETYKEFMSSLNNLMLFNLTKTEKMIIQNSIEALSNKDNDYFNLTGNTVPLMDISRKYSNIESHVSVINEKIGDLKNALKRISEFELQTEEKEYIKSILANIKQGNIEIIDNNNKLDKLIKISNQYQNVKLDLTDASQISGIIILFSMIFTPIFGTIVDRIGRRATLMIGGSILLIPCYILMGYTDLHPAIPMSIMGIAFSLVPAAMWPSIPLIVDEKRLGTAYGLMTLIQNIGLFSFPLLIGAVRDASGDYQSGMLIFSSLGLLGLLFAFLLKREENTERSSGLERIKSS